MAEDGLAALAKLTDGEIGAPDLKKSENSEYESLTSPSVSILLIMATSSISDA